ncbi:peptide chain release factor N(5)-glutamine methyltransferase [Noviherbaspirillum cavernae]|uniref:Release factor glutamine methyltransferase n=1 Tax=Noviherbaspirillum cavernae TaxID=2320862 RepID=A0A418X437_9BURK|nr:peptide chain release factor N(5)-glutamine methyltransferase [Noviherbaspirillum cavernae]RJG07232.1 peptide chain release factor N(5)-glutamine methyltransferase [Noviherbaspirillum cavernae]
MQDAPRTIRIAAGSTIAALLKKPPLDPLETRILLTHALKLSRVQLITQGERVLTHDEAQYLSALLQRRADGEPIAYIVGEREFYGLAFEVTPAVLIPRPETELLVELALERLPQNGRVLDMGTGSGAIAIAIAHSRPDATVTALDVSQDALAVARRNAQRHAADIRFVQSDWFEALDEQRFELIVSNPPYIVAGDDHLSQGDLRFEPLSALTDHGDGLDCLRTIVSGARDRLAPGGFLLMEHGYDQAAHVRALLTERQFHAVQSWCDLAGIERVTGGQHP